MACEAAVVLLLLLAVVVESVLPLVGDVKIETGCAWLVVG